MGSGFTATDVGVAGWGGMGVAIGTTMGGVSAEGKPTGSGLDGSFLVGVEAAAAAMASLRRD